jgi:RNA polymerase sigma-70 factor (ECF subfamily)
MSRWAGASPRLDAACDRDAPSLPDFVIRPAARPHALIQNMLRAALPSAEAPDALPQAGRSQVTVLKAPIDEQRLAALLSRHFRSVWRTLRRLGVPAEACDDAAQHVYIVAAGRLSEIRPDSERAFLVATAVRVAANARRSRAARPEIADAVAVNAQADAAPLADELLEERRLRALLDDVLESLPDDLRTVFVLFELEELGTQQIADALGIPRGTVASRLRRAREAFQEAARRLRARLSFRGELP